MTLRLVDMESGSWRRPVSLELQAKEFVLLLGRNGAGKTTLLNTIAGLLPVRCGRIWWQGRDVTPFDERGRTRCGIRIALEGRRVFRRLSVRKNLLLGAFGRKWSRADEQELEWVLDVFPDLRAKLDQSAGTLSGGQQTQVNIARSLMGRPGLLLLDEPALGLDPQRAQQVVRALREIRDECGLTALIAEQNGAFARAFPHRIIIIVGGEIVFDGPWMQAEEAGKLATVLA